MSNDVWKSLLVGGRFFPLAGVFLAALSIDLAAPYASHMAERPSSSPTWPASTYHDELGGSFIEPNGHSPWVLFLFWAVSDSAIMQRAVFAVRIGCGPGRWLARLAIALFVSGLPL